MLTVAVVQSVGPAQNGWRSFGSLPAHCCGALEQGTESITAYIYMPTGTECVCTEIPKVGLINILMLTII